MECSQRPGRVTPPPQPSGTVCSCLEEEIREQSRLKTSSFTCLTQVPPDARRAVLLKGGTRRFASWVHSQRVNIGSLLGSELEWMGGCSSLLMCIDLSVFAGNLRQIGSVKLWDEERCGG